jgi:hypothetical protein
MNQALIRERDYAFGAVAPKTGSRDFMMAENMKTRNMSLFLKQISQAHGNDFVIMVADGASARGSKEPVVPKNVPLIRCRHAHPNLTQPRGFGTSRGAIVSRISVLRHWMTP